jgi:S-adenosylmethionine decarboxylase
MAAPVMTDPNKLTPAAWQQLREHEQVFFSIHLTADFFEPATFVEDREQLRKILYGAARAANNTPLKSAIYKFPGQGITGVILLAESHISVHTWPEHGFMAVDIFTCGRDTKPVRALEYLKQMFSPKKVKIRHIRRGK